MNQIILAIFQALLVLLVAPLFSGIARSIRAKMHSRQGPSIFQDYYDLAKLMTRQDVRSKDSSYINRLMPPVYMGSMLLIAMGIPMLTQACPIPFLGDIVTIIYLLALPRFFFALAGIDTTAPYAGVGSIRELLVGVLIEPALLLPLFVAGLIAGSTNTGAIATALASGTVPPSLALILAGIAFAAACYVELGKLPYDMAEAEQELQEGPLQEYSGPSLAMLKTALSMKQVIMVSLFAGVFLPFGSMATASIGALLLALVVYLLKLLVLFGVCAIIENSVSRVRYRLLSKHTWTIFGIAVMSFAFFLIGL